MPNRDAPFSPTPQVHSICLDYGTDETSGRVKFSDSESGFSLQSRWQFKVGTELALDCAWCDPRLGARKVSVAGIVVGCERCADAGYETTVLLLDLPDDAKVSVHEFAHRK